MIRVVAALLLLSGCQTYFPVQSPVGDRLWLVSKDGRDVIRCLDLTPQTTPYAGGLRVICKDVEHYGTNQNPMFEGTAPAPSTVTTPKAP